MKQFECPECGSDELKFEKFVKCWEDVVIHPDGNIEFTNPEYDEGGSEGYYDEMFVCGNCGHSLELDGDFITDEDALIEYLSVTEKEQVAQEPEN